MARYPFLKGMILNYLVERRELTGYDFIKYCRTIGVTASPGSVYPHLKDLEDEGVVAQQTQGRRKIYTLTQKGVRTIAALPISRVPSFLKIYFFRSLGLAGAIDWSDPVEVEKLLANMREAQAQLEHFVENLKSAKT